MVKRLLLILCLCVVSAVALADPPTGNTTSATTLCQHVIGPAVATALAAQSGTGRRVKWSIWTTSGSATIYVYEGTDAALLQGATKAMPLTAGMSYTDDGPNVYSGAVTVVPKGTSDVYVCTNKVGS